MKQSDSHIIRSASVNLQYYGNADGMAIQQEVADWCRDVLLPSVESILSEYDQPDKVILIDSLSLDIDLEKTEDWKQALTENMDRQLKEKIQSRINSLKDSEVKSKSESYSEILLYFLEFGFLPWYSNFGNAEDFKVELVNWLNKTSSTEIKYLVHSLPDDRSIMRLVNTLDWQDFETLLATAVNEPGEKIALYFIDVKAVTDHLADDKILQERLLNELKEKIIRGFKADQTGDLFPDMIRKWLDDLHEENPELLLKIDPGLILNPEIKNHILRIQQDITQKSVISTGNKAVKQDKTGGKDSEISTKTRNGLEKELGEGIFVSNAGAVIIAPYLPRLFTNTGLTDDNLVTDRSMALSLANYCISGNKYPAEFELLLPKILCGVDPGEIVEITALKNEDMIREADQMLASVIEHWSVLKDTTVEGLREAFLQRNGKLTFTEDEWHLVVEQKPFDMLLEYLPWNYKMIKLPWMQNLLITQWV